MAEANGAGTIYSATYSNVPLYEFRHEQAHVMRRRSDDWINATHILKSAGLDKPARTRILERDIQKNMHEKVQGGYGKYQGTWVPLNDGRELAERYGILSRLLPIFDFVAGDKSPPPAPKHTTAASTKPKIPRAPASSKRAPKPVQAPSMGSEDHFSNMSTALHDDNTPDNSTIGSTEYLDDDPMSQSTRSLKRQYDAEVEAEARRDPVLNAVHTMYSDELLDYFLLRQESEFSTPPTMPESFDPNRPVDDSGHNALHWAASVADIQVCKMLIERGAGICSISTLGHTPLMRSLMFTNNYEQKCFPEMLTILEDSINAVDHNGNTAFHHAVNFLHFKDRTVMARFYMNALITKITELGGNEGAGILLDKQNDNGDTALHLAARYNNRKMVRMIMKQDIDVHLRNLEGETAIDLATACLGYDPTEEGYKPSPGPPMLPYLGMASDQLTPIYQADPDAPVPEAADTMAQTIIPLITEKTGKLAQTLRAEIQAKNNSHKEVLLALANTLNVQAAVTRDIDGLLQPDYGPVVNSVRDGYLDELLAENGVLLTQYLQYHIVKDSPLQDESHGAEAMSAKITPANAEFMMRLEAIRDLVEAEVEKKRLVNEMVAATSQAGTSEKSADYRKLLGISMLEPEEELAKVVPGVLEALEDVDEAEADAEVLPDAPM